jgi:hypothetical protein
MILHVKIPQRELTLQILFAIHWKIGASFVDVTIYKVEGEKDETKDKTNEKDEEHENGQNPKKKYENGEK